MSFLKKLFGGGNAAPRKAASESYNGFTITPQPVKEAHGYRIGALIEKDGQSHQMIRADTYAAPDIASDASVAKAKQMIDQMGDKLFG
jgi:hypothetical protein